jgi:hypothetical protein
LQFLTWRYVPITFFFFFLITFANFALLFLLVSPFLFVVFYKKVGVSLLSFFLLLFFVFFFFLLPFSNFVLLLFRFPILCSFSRELRCFFSFSFFFYWFFFPNFNVSSFFLGFLFFTALHGNVCVSILFVFLY